MGHYASEMQCDDCGKLRCICPPISVPERFAFDDHFDVVALSSLGLRRFFVPSFQTSAEALAARSRHIESLIASWEKDHAQRMAGLREALARAPKSPGPSAGARHGG